MAIFTVSSGQVQSGVTLHAGDTDIILSGGLSISTFVGSGAEQMVSAGGVARDTVVGSGGAEIVEGRLRSGEIQSGGVMSVDSGGVASSTAIDAGGTDYVMNGGTVVSSLVLGREVISVGGVASNTTNSGVQIIASAGSAVATSNYGLETVSAGGVAAGTQDFGDLEVLSGGSVISSTIGRGGMMDVHSGGLGSSTVINHAGEVTVENGGTLRTLTVNNGGSAVVLSGGTAGGVLIRAGGEATISSGGFMSNVNVQTNGTLTIDGGKTSGVLLSGGLELLLDGSVVSHSTIYDGGVQSLGSGSQDRASIISSGGTQIVGLHSKASNEVVKNGGVQIVSGSVSSDESGGIADKTTVKSGGEIVLMGNSEYTGVAFDIRSLHVLAGGSIDLTTLAFSTSETARVNNMSDKLVITDGGVETRIQLTGDYVGETFLLSDDGTGGTLLTLEGPPCYCRGTLVLTEAGEVPVENLRIGDRLVTKSGQARALRWIGRRAYQGAFIAGNRDLLPVTFRAGALDGLVPNRDLHVSPLHAMYLDGVLIPAIALVNGSSVVQAAAVDTVEYFHLELQTHDVIIAEGALAESFVDDDSRGMFHNAAEYAVLYPDAPRLPAVYCAPRVQDGPVLEAVRQRLAALAVPATLTLCRGYLEAASRDHLTGWAVDDADLTRRVRVVIRDHGVAIGEAVADRPRADLAATGLGDGDHGFELMIPGGLCPLTDHLITAETLDGTVLTGSVAVRAASPVVPLADDGMCALRGNADLITRERILGWAFNDANPQEAVAVQVVVDGVLAGSVVANRHRRDLEQASIGHGRCAFEHHFLPPLAALDRHVVELRFEATGQALAAPAVLEPAASFDGALERVIDAAVGGLGASGAEQRVLNFLEQQAARLRQIHAQAEAGQPARDDAAYRRRPMPVPRALVIDNEYPDAARDAGSRAVLSHMRALAELGHEVSFVASRQIDQAPPAGMAAAGISVCAAPFYASVEEVLRRQALGFDVVYIHRVGNAARYFALARDYQPNARILYSVADLHHLRLARQATVEERPELLAESNRVRLAECTAAWQADAVLTHSPVEAAELTRLVPGARVQVAPWAVELSLGSTPFALRHGVTFLGNYAHAPNVDAARHLVEHIMPLVWQGDETIMCRLVGVAMPEAVRMLAGPRVSVMGEVADLAGLLAQTRLTVAPLRYGAGIKGKVLDSFAAGVPCIVSPVAAEGLDLPRETIADSNQAFADAILRLHGNEAAFEAARLAGLAVLESGFTAAATRAAMRAALEPAALRATG